MVFYLCEGCGFIVDDEHTVISGAPTGQRLKECCPIWVQRQQDEEDNAQ